MNDLSRPRDRALNILDNYTTHVLGISISKPIDIIIVKGEYQKLENIHVVVLQRDGIVIPHDSETDDNRTPHLFGK